VQFAPGTADSQRLRFTRRAGTRGLRDAAGNSATTFHDPSMTPLRLDLGLPLPDAADRTGVHPIALAGERVELLALRALHWPAMATVFVADVHLGKAAAFRAGGVPLPRGSTASDLGRLSDLVARTRARRLVVLGDFLHAAAGRVPALDATFGEWRERNAGLELLLVRGNHDHRAGDPPAHWNVAVVDEPHALAPFLACHAPVSPRSGYALCGHVHPGVWLTGTAEQRERLPCFVLGKRRAILPAFGAFTGLASAQPARGDHLVAIAGSRLFALPARSD
jgi:DNA ligase-associated metallophosphoesterase